MKRFITCTFAALALMGSVSAQATLIGNFASGDWTAYLNGGTATENTPTSITLSGDVVYKAGADQPQVVTLDFGAPEIPFDICVNDDCSPGDGQMDIPLAAGDEISIVSGPEGSTETVRYVSAIPEPATPALLGAGLLLGLAMFGRRKAG